VGRLSRIPGLEKQAPKLAEQFFDSVVLHGGKNAATLLQRATDDVMGTDLREPDPKKPKVKVYDGNIGPKIKSMALRVVLCGGYFFV
jgi:lysozyme family protein